MLQLIDAGLYIKWDKAHQYLTWRGCFKSGLALGFGTRVVGIIDDSLKNLEITNYTTPTLTPDFHATEPGRKLLEKEFDIDNCF